MNAGKASRASTTIEMTRSVQPRRYPAIMPSVVPTTSPTTMLVTPMISEMRAP